jgi:hypothetical protein
MSWVFELRAGGRGAEGTEGARLRLTRSAVAFAMMCPMKEREMRRLRRERETSIIKVGEGRMFACERDVYYWSGEREIDVYCGGFIEATFSH